MMAAAIQPRRLRLLSTLSLSPSPLAPTVKGTAFEHRSMKILQDNLSMSLRRVGGKSDGGIDLLGWWWLPSTPPDAETPSKWRRLRVIGQCKAEKKKTSPKYIRELEGVLHRYISLQNEHAPVYTSDQPRHPLVALFISESPFTKATILRAHSSPVPFFLLHIPPLPLTDSASPTEEDPLGHDYVGAAVWNPALGGTRGLLGGQMEVRWERASAGIGRPRLWWGGRQLGSWTPDGDVERDDASVLSMEDGNEFFKDSC